MSANYRLLLGTYIHSYKWRAARFQISQLQYRLGMHGSHGARSSLHGCRDAANGWLTAIKCKTPPLTVSVKPRAQVGIVSESFELPHSGSVQYLTSTYTIGTAGTAQDA